MGDVKRQIVRIAVAKGVTQFGMGTEFTFNTDRHSDSTRTVQITKQECGTCKGTGQIMLFTSHAPCDMCLGASYYFEGFDE